MKPIFIGIGVQKCATSWIFKMLDAHPEIFIAKSKEGKKNIYFFDHFYNRGYSWYQEYFTNVEGNVVGEFSTSYFFNTNTASRIYEYYPKMKILVSLRDPIERAYSQYKHEVNQGRVDSTRIGFEEALDKNPTYTEQSLYYKNLIPWLDYFSLEKFHFILVEEIRNNPRITVANMYQFVGADPLFTPKGINGRIHSSSDLKCKPGSIYFLIKKGGKKGKNIWGMKSDRNVLSSSLKLIDRKRNANTLFPPMLDNTRRRLKKYFRDDVQLLTETFKVNTSNWLI